MAEKKDKPPTITPAIISRARRALWNAVFATKFKKQPKRKGGRRVH